VSELLRRVDEGALRRTTRRFEKQVCGCEVTAGRSRLVPSTLAGLFFLLCACGYRFTAPGGPLPQGIRAAQVPMMGNVTPEPSAETFFTQALREQLQRAGTLGGDAADARIEGTLLAVTSAPMVTSPTGRGPTYRLAAVVQLKLVRSGTVLADIQVAGDEDVQPALKGTAPDVLLTEANRQAGLRRLADTMMREGYERLCSGW
jgi:hypothetical protein